MSKTELKVWHDDVETYIAESAEHAHRLQAATLGSEEDATPPDKW